MVITQLRGTYHFGCHKKASYARIHHPRLLSIVKQGIKAIRKRPVQSSALAWRFSCPQSQCRWEMPFHEYAGVPPTSVYVPCHTIEPFKRGRNVANCELDTSIFIFASMSYWKKSTNGAWESLLSRPNEVDVIICGGTVAWFNPRRGSRIPY